LCTRILIEDWPYYYSSRRSKGSVVGFVAERSLIDWESEVFSKAEDLRVQVGSLAG